MWARSPDLYVLGGGEDVEGSLQERGAKRDGCIIFAGDGRDPNKHAVAGGINVLINTIQNTSVKEKKLLKRKKETGISAFSGCYRHRGDGGREWRADGRVPQSDVKKTNRTEKERIWSKNEPSNAMANDNQNTSA